MMSTSLRIWEGEAPAEPLLFVGTRLRRTFALPLLTKCELLLVDKYKTL